MPNPNTTPTPGLGGTAANRRQNANATHGGWNAIGAGAMYGSISGRAATVAPVGGFDTKEANRTGQPAPPMPGGQDGMSTPDLNNNLGAPNLPGLNKTLGLKGESCANCNGDSLDLTTDTARPAATLPALSAPGGGGLMGSSPMSSNPFPAPPSIDGVQRVSGTCSTGEMVNLSTGNLMFMVTVVDVPTIGLPLRLFLFYNSQGGGALLGPRWRHNYAMNLTFTPAPPAAPTMITFTSDTGRQYDFAQEPGSGDWVLDTWDPDVLGNSFAYPGTLASSGSNWQITFPNGCKFEFDAGGKLINQYDRHFNHTSFAYGGFDNLVSITEPTGRQITLEYNSYGNLSSITDPNGNVTSLISATGAGGNLLSIASPTGCTVNYGYDSDGRVIYRWDARSLNPPPNPGPNDYTYTFTYDAYGRITTITDSESTAHTLTYTYSGISVPPDPTEAGVSENTGDSESEIFPWTKVADAQTPSNTWEYRFDRSPWSNLWRVIDPLGHSTHYYWDSGSVDYPQGTPMQKLLYQSEPYLNDPASIGPTDDLYNMFRRWTYDDAGNLTYSVDGSGILSQNTYSASRMLTSTYFGQANLAVQGNWTAEYGADGYILCAFDNASTDRQALPSYVSSVTSGTPGFDRANLNGSIPLSIIDPRAPVAKDSLIRGLGYWMSQSGNSSFEFQVSLSQAQQFNLSIYTNSTDVGLNSSSVLYYEQFGRDQTISVTDQHGTQTFRIYNNATGPWITFPVQGDATHPITVSIANSDPTITDTRISAIAFDPIDSRQTTFTYTGDNDPLTIVDALGNQTTMTYNSDGTLATITDALSHETKLYYLDAHKNLTKITDANSNDTLLTYDAVGNVTSVEDANGHTWLYEYDAKNRLITITDPLHNNTSIEYDPAGNVRQIIDANNNLTQFTYFPSNRLKTITDALNQVTSFTYDGPGNLLTVTDPLMRVTTYTYDIANRVTQVTPPSLSPDPTPIVTAAYDGRGNLKAFTSPNGNISSPNTTGAANLVKNPDMEVGNTTTLQAQAWTSDTANPWSTAHAHSPTHSLLGGAVQQSLFFPPGAKGLINSWTLAPNASGTATAQNGLYIRDLNAGLPTTSSSGASLTNTSPWTQIPTLAFSVPGDSQYARFTLDPLVGSITLPAEYWDDFTVQMLSTAMNYDREGRLITTQAPDGAVSSVTRDRWGRVTQATDARGRTTQISYDALNRPLRIVDPDGNTFSYAYDAVGNLTSFTDPNGTTQYAYDNLNRLETITYPDTTTEQFVYDAVGNLYTYTNNRSQMRTFVYDAADRLTSVTYNTDSTQVSFTYDSVGNVLSRTERNGDISGFSYDAIYRLINDGHESASSSPSWGHSNSFDAVGNRTAFNINAGPLYDFAHFNTDTFGSTADNWTASYDNLDRLSSYEDSHSNVTSFDYDIESRRNQINYPNGSPAPVTAAAYDVVGKLLSLNTTEGGTTLLPLSYAYDQASNRLSQVTSGDTFDYGIDDAGQLISEAFNRLVERGYENFQNGTVNAATADPTSGTVALLPFNDSFSGGIFDSDRWYYGLTPVDLIGLEVRQNTGMQICFPRGYSDNIFNSQPPVYDSLGIRLDTPAAWYAVSHRVQLTGDFDVQVDYADFQVATAGLTYEGSAFYLMVNDVLYENNPQNLAVMSRLNQVGVGNLYNAVVVTSGTTQASGSDATTDTSGTLRITRTGTTLLPPVPTVTLYYWNGSSWTTVATYGSFVSSALYLTFFGFFFGAASNVTLHNLTLNSPTNQYPTSGTYTSGVYDAGRNVTPEQIWWTASTPGTSTVEFQVATSSMPAPFSVTGTLTSSSSTVSSVSSADIAKLFVGATVQHADLPSGTTISTIGSTSFTVSNNATANATAASLTVSGTLVGPDGTPSTYFTSSPAVLPSILAGNRYIYYQATLTGGSVTPTISEVDITFAGTNGSQLVTYAYDGSGNMISKTNASSFNITGTLTSSSATVSSVSSGDIAMLYVGATVQHADLPTGTTVATIGTTSFTVNNNATANASGATLMISGTATDVRNNWITGTVTSGSSTVTNVSAADIARLTVGNGIVYNAFPGGTTISSISTSSFVVSNNATASMATALIPFTDTAWSSSDLINNLNQIKRQDVTPAGSATTTSFRFAFDASGNMTSKTPTYPITGTLASGSNNVTAVSASDIATLYVGAPVAHADLPSGTTVSTISSGSFTVSHNATANVTGATVTVTGQFIAGTLTSGSNTVTAVSPYDLARLYVGAPLASSNLPGSTTVASVSSTSFTMNNNATGTASASTIAIAGGATSYTWDEDNRLTQVSLPGSVTVSYGYDVIGRMLTRTDASGTAKFEWDGMNMVRETQPSGNVLVYYAPLGELVSFDRTVSGVTTTYQLHSDALGSVRKITDNTGSVVSTFDYDAWGNALPTTSDSLDFAYRFVGSLGIRWDAIPSLHYCTARWFEPGLHRFISRDLEMSPTPESISSIDVSRFSNLVSNPYIYGLNNPTVYVDSLGLAPSRIFHWVVVIAKVGKKFIKRKGCKVRTAVKNKYRYVRKAKCSTSTAAQNIEEAEDIISETTSSARDVTRMSQGGGTRVEQHGNWPRHTHNRARAGGHSSGGDIVGILIAGGYTISYFTQDKSIGWAVIGEVADFWNPLTILQDYGDAVTIIECVAETQLPRDTRWRDRRLNDPRYGDRGL